MKPIKAFFDQEKKFFRFFQNGEEISFISKYTFSQDHEQAKKLQAGLGYWSGETNMNIDCLVLLVDENEARKNEK